MRIVLIGYQWSVFTKKAKEALDNSHTPFVFRSAPEGVHPSNSNPHYRMMPTMLVETPDDDLCYSGIDEVLRAIKKMQDQKEASS